MDHSSDEQILNFMQITECQDFKKAKNYMLMANNSLENAISLFMELEGHQSKSLHSSIPNSLQTSAPIQEESKFVQEVNTQIFNSQFPQPSNIRQNSNPLPAENIRMIENYKKFLKEKESNDDGIMRKIYNSTIGWIPKIFKSQKDEAAEFLSALHKAKIHVEIQFSTGNFTDNLDKALQNFKPLLVYIHDPRSNIYISSILNNPQLYQMLNKNFRNIGFMNNSEAVQQLQQQQFAIDKSPAFYIFRKDIFEKTIFMAVIEILPNMDIGELINKLKQLKAQHNKQYIFEEQIKKEVIESDRRQYVQNVQNNVYEPNPYVQQQYQQQGHEHIFHSQYQQINPNTNQLNQQQQAKLQQERELRLQQEFALRQAEEESRRIQKQKEEERKKQKELEDQKHKQQEEKLYRKAKLLSELPEEPSSDATDILQFLFRMPDGSNIERRFLINEPIKHLFNFIFCQNEECFENPDGEFDLIQNFPKLSLLDYTDKNISDIFQETVMEQLIVKEL